MTFLYQRQVEISAIIEGYFQILLKQCEDEIDIPLQRALLGELPFLFSKCVSD